MLKTLFTWRILKEHSKVTWRVLGYSRHLDTQALEALRPSKGTSALGRSSYLGTWRLEGHLDTQIFKIPGDFFLKTHITYIYIHIYLQRRSDFALSITFEFENACHKKLKRTNIFFSKHLADSELTNKCCWYGGYNCVYHPMWYIVVLQTKLILLLYHQHLVIGLQGQIFSCSTG